MRICKKARKIYQRKIKVQILQEYSQILDENSNKNSNEDKTNESSI